jgi:hypothetical protein
MQSMKIVFSLELLRDVSTKTNLHEFSSPAQFQNMHSYKRHYDAKPKKRANSPDNVACNVDSIQSDKYGLKSWAI